MKPKTVRTAIYGLVLALTLGLMIRADLAPLRWASRLSTQGSPAPARDPHSPTGYAMNERYFVGTHERGDTYRWIALAQSVAAHGLPGPRSYPDDNVPEGRPELRPLLYAWWLAAVAGGLAVITGTTGPIATEQAALWAPILAHALLFVGVVTFTWRRFGRVAAALAGVFFAFFPVFSAQFLPGVLSTRTAALFLGAYAIALHAAYRPTRDDRIGFGVHAGIVTAVSLWLQPTIGFRVVVITALAGIVLILERKGARPFLAWSLAGAATTLAAWLIDRNPWTVSAGELRHIHPLYALAWLGIGFGLDAGQGLRTAARRRWRYVEIALAAACIAPLAHSQITHGYRGWLYAEATMRRLSSIDESRIFNTLPDWVRSTPASDVAWVLAPIAAAFAALVLLRRRHRGAPEETPGSWSAPLVLLIGVLVCAYFEVRWLLVALLLAAVLICRATRDASPTLRRITVAAAIAFVLGSAAWGRALPSWLDRHAATAVAADIDALVNRHIAYWFATHNPGQPVVALASPELSDSLVFHGHCRVLMSTAWESYPGQLAASRILSAPEATEAEAVLQGREITHVILSSWDKVLPLLVQAPKEPGRDTFYARLQRWVLPPFLRPIPYHLPDVPGYAGQKLAIFKVVPAQDDGLLLSRLAEYFVEMNRAEPATLAARFLADRFPDDPNAVIARATVYQATGDRDAFARELSRLVADATDNKIPSSWDRRVQRAIVLALGGRDALARSEVDACLAQCTAEHLLDLTPLQAHRLAVLARGYGFSFPEPKLAELTSALGAEYANAPEGKPAA